MNFAKAALFAGVPLLLLAAACSDPASKSQTTHDHRHGDATGRPRPRRRRPRSLTPQTVPAPDVASRAARTSRRSWSRPRRSPQPIDTADWTAEPVTPQAKKNALLRAEVLLARAHFSPGVIDGQDGGNLQNAIAAFETAHGLPVDGKMDAGRSGPRSPRTRSRR